MIAYHWHDGPASASENPAFLHSSHFEVQRLAIAQCTVAVALKRAAQLGNHFWFGGHPLRPDLRHESWSIAPNYKYTANSTNSSSNLLDTMALRIRFILSAHPYHQYRIKTFHHMLRGLSSRFLIFASFWIFGYSSMIWTSIEFEVNSFGAEQKAEREREKIRCWWFYRSRWVPCGRRCYGIRPVAVAQCVVQRRLNASYRCKLPELHGRVFARRPHHDAVSFDQMKVKTTMHSESFHGEHTLIEQWKPAFWHTSGEGKFL